MKLLKRGAEGDLYLTKYDGNDAILKTRKKKSYRNADLDEKIRRQRTIREATILSQIKSFGVLSPLVYQVDINECTILMQHLKGLPVWELKGKKLISACKQIGKITGVLHENGIMHGDLTTSNFIAQNGKIYALDFGLAQRTSRIEDHAVDLRLFKEILNSAHVELMKRLWSSFLAGYKSAVGSERFNKVISYVSVIEGRGRYATVV
ncbi:MAG: KEOPS complex kinase/ATPase Bud32 [Candidatus Nitrosotenuis sp.]